MPAFIPCAGDIELDRREFSPRDIDLLYCGYEKCSPGHSYGPDMRNHYVFHLILSGRGTFKSAGTLFPLTARQGFLLTPQTQVYYCADIEEPWEYVWAGFSGRSSGRVAGMAGMSPSLPVVSCGSLFPELSELILGTAQAAQGGGAEGALESYGLFLQFLSRLSRCSRMRDEQLETRDGAPAGPYVERAKEFIRENLSRDITASDVAASLRLNRSYFCKIFTAACGKSPTQFIAWYRLNTALNLLQHTRMPIAEIASHVGYNDPAYFTRRFKAFFGQSPATVRNATQPTPG